MLLTGCIGKNESRSGSNQQDLVICNVHAEKKYTTDRESRISVQNMRKSSIHLYCHLLCNCKLFLARLLQPIKAYVALQPQFTRLLQPNKSICGIIAIRVFHVCHSVVYSLTILKHLDKESVLYKPMKIVSCYITTIGEASFISRKWLSQVYACIDGCYKIKNPDYCSYLFS